MSFEVVHVEVQGKIDCDCGETINFSCNADNTIFPECEKCGKEYKVWLDGRAGNCCHVK